MVSCTVPALTKTLALIDFLIANGTKSDVIRVFLGVRNQILLPCAAIKGACRPPASRKQKSRVKKNKNMVKLLIFVTFLAQVSVADNRR